MLVLSLPGLDKKLEGCGFKAKAYSSVILCFLLISITLLLFNMHHQIRVHFGELLKILTPVMVPFEQTPFDSFVFPSILSVLLAFNLLLFWLFYSYTSHTIQTELNHWKCWENIMLFLKSYSRWCDGFPLCSLVTMDHWLLNTACTEYHLQFNHQPLKTPGSTPQRCNTWVCCLWKCYCH